MSRFRVIATASSDSPIDLAAFTSGLAGLADVECRPLPYHRMDALEEDAAAENLCAADGLFVRIGYLSAALIGRLPRLRVITLHGVGVDQVDLPAALARRIPVTNVPGANAQAVAEHAIGLMLAVFRHTVVADARLRQGAWQEARILGEEMSGKTLGVVGLGNIGRRVAALGQAFGMTIVAYSPSCAVAPPGVTLVELNTLLRTADVVTVHASLNAQTVGLLNADSLALMKTTSILVNTARGQLVTECALVGALREGRIAGAALDVFSQEPPDPRSPLLGLPNVVLSPHLGSSTTGALRCIARRGGEDMARVLRGEPPLHRVV